jgi:hypothetical protein
MAMAADEALLVGPGLASGVTTVGQPKGSRPKRLQFS